MSVDVVLDIMQMDTVDASTTVRSQLYVQGAGWLDFSCLLGRRHRGKRFRYCDTCYRSVVCLSVLLCVCINVVCHWTE